MDVTLLEKGVEAAPSPALVTQSLPCVVVSSRAAIVHHAIQNRSTSQHLSDAGVPCPVVESWLRLTDIVGPQK